MKGLQPARMVAEDGPRKHCPHSAPSEEKKKKKHSIGKESDPAGPDVM